MRSDKRTRLGIAVLVFLAFLLLAEALLALFADDILRTHYRKEFSGFVGQYASEYGVPENLVYAVILSESGFRPDAVSGAGAKGLMQMMDASFQEMRGRIGLEGEEYIFDPEQNIRCGVYCLAYLNRYFGDWDTAVAAYNAGIGNVMNWLKDASLSSDGVHLDAIPFCETETYLKRIKRAEKAYKILYRS